MKSLKGRVLLLCISAILTLGLSHAVAQTCADIEAGGDVYGDFDCRLTNSCDGWCYYSCSCSNVIYGYTCKNVLEEAGFELVSAPQC
jgi:hypothetical protein